MGSLQDLVGYGRYEEAMALATIFVALLSHVPLFAQPRSGYRAQPTLLPFLALNRILFSKKNYARRLDIHASYLLAIQEVAAGNICTSSDLYVKVP